MLRAEWLEKQIAECNPDSGCLLWPYARMGAGYGNLWFRGEHRPAHRAALILHAGECPVTKRYAAHKCGVKLCVNPYHLYWATPKENESDKIGHGTDRRGKFGVGEEHYKSLVADAEWEDILDMYATGAFTQQEIADMYGVHQVTISHGLIRLRDGIRKR